MSAHGITIIYHFRVWASAKQLKPLLSMYDVAIFIISLIVFDFGFEL